MNREVEEEGEKKVKDVPSHLDDDITIKIPRSA